MATRDFLRRGYKIISRNPLDSIDKIDDIVNERWTMARYRGIPKTPK
jgi:hypothetical protein